MFSVIIPTLNEEQFLPNLLDSLTKQTEKPFEVIVVDGKSKDKTVAVAQSFRKKLPIRIIECERSNLPMQRNRGAREARGEWLVFVDADSTLLPYCLDRLSAYLRKGACRFATAWGKPDSLRMQDAIVTTIYNLFLEGSLLFKKQLSPGPFTVIEREAFASVGGYDETLRFGEDQNLSVRLAGAGVPLGIVRETLYVWSMRRFRVQGMLRSLQVYTKAALRVLFTGKNYQHIPGYRMGGQEYARHR